MGPYRSDRAGMFFILGTAGKPESIVPAMRRAVAEVDPNKPAGNIHTVEDYFDRQVHHLRTREIGIRVALGAGGREVLALVARQAAMVISIGLALGLGGSFALTRLLKSALVGVTATDPSTYSVVSPALAVLACLVPTRRAIAVDPTIALRYE